MAILSKPKYWFQTKTWRIALLVIGVVVVLGLVVFNKQLANLTSLFGSKASTNQHAVQLNNTLNNFLPAESETPANSFKLDSQGRLMLNDTGNPVFIHNPPSFKPKMQNQNHNHHIPLVASILTVLVGIGMFASVWTGTASAQTSPSGSVHFANPTASSVWAVGHWYDISIDSITTGLTGPGNFRIDLSSTQFLAVD